MKAFIKFNKEAIRKIVKKLDKKAGLRKERARLPGMMQQLKQEPFTCSLLKEVEGFAGALEEICTPDKVLLLRSKVLAASGASGKDDAVLRPVPMLFSVCIGVAAL